MSINLVTDQLVLTSHRLTTTGGYVYIDDITVATTGNVYNYTNSGNLQNTGIILYSLITNMSGNSIIDGGTF